MSGSSHGISTHVIDLDVFKVLNASIQQSHAVKFHQLAVSADVELSQIPPMIESRDFRLRFSPWIGSR